mmetsp:Transcript_3684/g.4087  ORF Transcript_3684/g.4087 Transcript_3684/m.4087 type:complete len:127 (+) Transcript_3684:44-424(+)
MSGKQRIRKGFVMKVNPGSEAEYEKRHNPIWKELEDVLKAHGVYNYSIFLHPETKQLFGYVRNINIAFYALVFIAPQVELDSIEKWETISKEPICKKWWSHMKDIMPSNPDNSPVMKPLKEVFHID